MPPFGVVGDLAQRGGGTLWLGADALEPRAPEYSKILPNIPLIGVLLSRINKALSKALYNGKMQRFSICYI